MKINRFVALAAIALLVVGAMGAISAKSFAKGNAAPAAQATVQAQDCSQDQADGAEAQDAADTDNVDLQCGDQNAPDGQEAAADVDTDNIEEQAGEQVEDGQPDTAEAPGAEDAGQDEQTPSYVGSITVDQAATEGMSEADEATALQSQATISAADAEAAALAANPGTTVVKTELDNENGALVYSVELSNGTDIKVDAGTGSILFTDSGADIEQ